MLPRLHAASHSRIVPVAPTLEKTRICGPSSFLTVTTASLCAVKDWRAAPTTRRSGMRMVMHACRVFVRPTSDLVCRWRGVLAPERVVAGISASAFAEASPGFSEARGRDLPSARNPDPLGGSGSDARVFQPGRGCDQRWLRALVRPVNTKSTKSAPLRPIASTLGPLIPSMLAALSAMPITGTSPQRGRPDPASE